MRYAFVALCIFIVIFCAARLAQAQQPLDVDVALVLVMDISDSVDGDEFALQRVGTAGAFVDPEIVNAISSGALGRIAVSVVEFANEAVIVVPWTVISDAKSARAFAATVTGAPRSNDVGTGTSISAGISLANKVILTMPYRATRKVMDVSGDGTNNTDAEGITVEVVTKIAKAQHITINGLTLALCLFFQTGPVPRTEWIAPVSVDRDTHAAVIHEELLKYGAWVQFKVRF